MAVSSPGLSDQQASLDTPWVSLSPRAGEWRLRPSCAGAAGLAVLAFPLMSGPSAHLSLSASGTRPSSPPAALSRLESCPGFPPAGLSGSLPLSLSCPHGGGMGSSLDRGPCSAQALGSLGPRRSRKPWGSARPRGARGAGACVSLARSCRRPCREHRCQSSCGLWPPRGDGWESAAGAQAARTRELEAGSSLRGHL